jgi:uncharacterized protein YegJ (DUF2314 family)
MENPRNIFTTCPKHSSRPQLKYLFWNPKEFLDKWIKMEFSEKSTGRKEHLWIKITAIKEEKTLLGIIDNDPVLNLDVFCGDQVTVPISAIEACFDGKNNL